MQREEKSKEETVPPRFDVTLGGVCVIVGSEGWILIDGYPNFPILSLEPDWCGFAIGFAIALGWWDQISDQNSSYGQ